MCFGNIMRKLLCAGIGAGMAASLTFAAFAETTFYGSAAVPVKLVVDCEYLDGKVNDPVSRRSQNAFLAYENPSIHLEASQGDFTSISIVVYSNEFVEGQDVGVRNRIVSRKVGVGESVQILPDDYFEKGRADGSLYDFANRCYDLRVYYDEDEKTYEDYYFGLIEDEMYMNMFNAAAEEQDGGAVALEGHPGEEAVTVYESFGSEFPAAGGHPTGHGMAELESERPEHGPGSERGW